MRKTARESEDMVGVRRDEVAWVRGLGGCSGLEIGVSR